jgi:hypothetical protein
MTQYTTSNIISQFNTCELYDYLIKKPEQYYNIYKLNISKLDNKYKQNVLVIIVIILQIQLILIYLN